MLRHRRFVIAAITFGLGAAAGGQDSVDERRTDAVPGGRSQSIETSASGGVGEERSLQERDERDLRDTVEELRAGMVAGDLRATDLIGTAIFARDGDQLGQVDDLVLSAEDGRVYAVLAIGGLLGIGQRLICVPLDVLEIRRLRAEDGETRVLVLPVSPEELREWPVFRYEVARNAARTSGESNVLADPRGTPDGNQMS